MILFNQYLLRQNINILSLWRRYMDKPNILRRLIMRVVHIWRRVMNVKFNPLKHIPDNTLQSYFMLVLFTIWSITFGFIATYYIGWLGYSTITSVVVHLTILIPIMITNAEWQSEQSRYKLFTNRLKAKNLVRWKVDSEA